MIRVAERLAAEHSHARLLLSVHDELLFEVPRDEVEPLAAIVRETMEGALPLGAADRRREGRRSDREVMTPLTPPDAVPPRPTRFARSSGTGSRAGAGVRSPRDARAARSRNCRPRPAPAPRGRHDLGARCDWPRTLRTHTPRRSRGVAGRRIEAVGRRAKLLVIELSGASVVTIHLKMTGQLFVVPADAPLDPYMRLVLELADGRELRFRDIRKFGKIGVRP